MGNTHAGGRTDGAEEGASGHAAGTIPEEPNWTLPPSQSDNQFLRAAMDDIFDKDFLRKSFMGPEMSLIERTLASPSQAAGAIGGSASGDLGVKLGGSRSNGEVVASLDEAEALADAVACLAYPYDATARRMTVTRLTEDLTQQCREEDPFTTTVAQRVHFLRCMHAAMVRAWPHRQLQQKELLLNEGNESPSQRRSGMLRRVLIGGLDEEEEEESGRTASPEDLTYRRRRRGRRRRPAPTRPGHGGDDAIRNKLRPEASSTESFGLSHTVRLGLSMFFTMLDCMQVDAACTIEQYASLMRQVVPLVRTLAPPDANIALEGIMRRALQDRARQDGQGEQEDSEESTDSSESSVGLPPVGVLNEICDFLYRASMGRKYSGAIQPGLLDDEILLNAASSMRKRPHTPRPSTASSSASSASIQKGKKDGEEEEKQGDGPELRKQAFESLPVSSEERTQALEALYSLSFSRAKLVDFLLCVKVLLEEVNTHEEDLPPSFSFEWGDFEQQDQDSIMSSGIPAGLTVNTQPGKLAGASLVHTPADALTPSYSPSRDKASPTTQMLAGVAIGGIGVTALQKLDSATETDDEGDGVGASAVGSKADLIAKGGISGGGGSPVSPSTGAHAWKRKGRDACDDGNESARVGGTTATLQGHSSNNNNHEESRSPREWAVKGSALVDDVNVQRNNSSSSSSGDLERTILSPLDVGPMVGAMQDLDCKALFRSDILGGKAEQVQVWSFGQNSYGELAQGDTITQKLPRKATVLDEKDVVQVAAGNEHTVVLTRNGRVYAVGYNDNGQCGQGNTGRVAHLSNIEALNGKGVVQVHAYNGCEHTLCVTEEGGLYSFGYNYRGQLGHGNTGSLSLPQLVSGFGTPGRRVTLVSCSYYHSVVATDSGELYTFGRNDFGQLGHGDTSDRKEPAKVEGLPQEGITSVACGQYHTIVSMQSGSVYACGKNDYGQLGLKLPEPHRRITLVRFFGGRSMIDLAEAKGDREIVELRCGYYHTIAMSASGKLWAFGRNDYGQLGIGNATQKVFSPREVEDLDGATTRIVRIAAGCYHSIAVDEQGTLYVFGRNNHGQLGCGESTEKHSPWPVKSFAGQRIADVAAGFYHTIILTGGEDDNDTNTDPDDLIFSKNDLMLRTGVFQARERILAMVQRSKDGCQRRPMEPFHVALLTLHVLDRIAAFHKERQEKFHKWHGRTFPNLDPLALLEQQHKQHLHKQQLVAAQEGKKKEDVVKLSREDLRRRLPAAQVPFCIDPDPRTLALLVFVAKLCQERLKNLSMETEARVETRLVLWSYMTLALMRLMRNNVAQLLWSGKGPELQREMFMANQRTHVPPMVKALDEVHRFALDVIESPPVMDSMTSTEETQALASEILMTGLELFYPTQELQVQLLASLMAETDEDDARDGEKRAIEDEADIMRFSPRSPLMKFQSTASAVFSKGLRKYLLEPLLRRLADDEIVSAMVPYHSTIRVPTTPAARGVINRVLVESSDDTHASVALLSSLLSSLVRQISSQSAARVHAATSFGGGSMPNNTGFLQLLLSLQKHLLSWAANSSHPTEDNSDVGAITKHLEHLVESSAAAPAENKAVGQGATPAIKNERLVEETKQDLEIDDLDEELGAGQLQGCAWKAIANNATSWECLLRYAELVFRQANEELSSVLNTGADMVEVLSHGSVLAGVLPSLVVGLKLFAHRTFFATRLLARVLDTLALVDEVVCALPGMVAADTAYRQASDHFGGESASSPAKDEEDKAKVEQRRKKRVEEALALANLPWLVQLEKALSGLGGRFASTLVVGHVEGEQREGMVPTAEGQDPVLRDAYVVWRDSDLLSGGLDQHYVSQSHAMEGLSFAVERDGSAAESGAARVAPSKSYSKQHHFIGGGIKLEQRRQKKPRQAGTTLMASTPSTSKSASFFLGLDECSIFSQVEQERFVQRILKSEDAIVDSLRKAHAAKDFSYKMTLVQGRGNGDAAAMELVECAVFAAILKHGGALVDGLLFSKNLEQEGIKPHARVQRCWKAAADIRKHLVRLRSQLMASNDTSGDTEEASNEMSLFQDFCACYTKRARFLLLFLSADEEQNGASVRRSRGTAAKSSTANRHWRLLRTAVWTAIRWKRAAKEDFGGADHAAVHQVIRFIKCPTDLDMANLNAPPSSPTRKPSSPSKRRKQLMQQQHFHLGTLFLMILNNCRRACLRASGLDAFRALINVPRLESARSDVLRFLAPSLRGVARSENPGENHYTNGLGAAGTTFTQHVQRSFLSLYELLAKRLRDALATDSVALSHERLLLLDAWAMSLGPLDLSLVSQTGLLKVLQGALAMDRDLDAASGGAGATPKSSSGKGEAPETKRKRQIGRAAWMLFRLLLAQVGGGQSLSVESHQVNPLLDVLYAELQASLAAMLPEGLKGDTEQSPGHKQAHNQQSNHKHMRELVDEPMRLTNVGGGVTLSSGSMASEEERGFSVSMWVLCESQASGGLDRVLMSRGDCKPMLTIRDIDNRMELWSEVGGLESERIVSKHPLPTDEWTHVAVVVENGRLSLFVDGVLDGRESQESLAFDEEEDNHEEPVLHLGKARLDRMLGGMEGYIAQVKYHTRALSPIHLHIMFDQGPPKQIRVLDRHCYQLVVIQQTLTETAFGRKALARPQWLELHARLLKCGTPRVQQAVLRLWRVLFPMLAPREIAPHVLPLLISNSSQHHKDHLSGQDLADYLLAQIGVGVWTGNKSKGGSSHGSDDQREEEITEETKRGADVEGDNGAPDVASMEGNNERKSGSKKIKSRFDLRCDTTAVAPAKVMSRSREDVQVQTSVHGQAGNSHHSFALSSELIMLVRLLANHSNWGPILSERMQDAMSDISEHLFSPKASLPNLKMNQENGHCAENEDEDDESDSLQALRSVGTLAVLGGHTENIRVGGRVAMTHADITATVVAFDPEGRASNATVVITPTKASTAKAEEETAHEGKSSGEGGTGGDAGAGGKDGSDAQQSDTSGTQKEERSMRPVRMNAEELVPIPEFRSPFASLSPKKKKRFNTFDDTEFKNDEDGENEMCNPSASANPMMDRTSDSGPPTSTLEDSFIRLLEHLFVFSVPPQRSGKMVLLAQCRARTLKVLHEMLQTSECNFQQLFDHHIASALLRLAIQPVDKDKFVTLDGVEFRTTELRQRLHQLRAAGASGRQTQSSSSGKEFKSGVVEVGVLTLSDDDDDEAATMQGISNSSQGGFTRQSQGLPDGEVDDDGEEDDLEEEDDLDVDDDDDDEDDLDDDEDDDIDDDEEDELDEDGEGGAAATAPVANIASSDPNAPPSYLVDELVAMGFPEEWCIIALRIQGFDLIAASSWIVDNLDMLSCTPLNELLPPSSGGGASLATTGGVDLNEDGTGAHVHGATGAASEATVAPLGSDGDGSGSVVVEDEDLQFHQQRQKEQQDQDALKRKDHEDSKKKELKRRRRKLLRAKASVRNMVEPFQQLEEAFGQESFADNCFRADACASYGYGYICGALGLYNGLHAEGGSSDAAREAFRSETALMPFEELERLCAEMERALSVLYARSCIVVLLQRWRQWPEPSIRFESVFGTTEEPVHNFVDFLRVSLFRGPQIMPSYEVSMLASGQTLIDCDLPGLASVVAAKEDSIEGLCAQLPEIGGLSDLMPAPLGSTRPTRNESRTDDKQKRNPAAWGAAGSVIVLMVRALQPALEQFLRRREDGQGAHLCASLVDRAMSDLEAAAQSEEHVDTEWGTRDYSVSDKVALEQPNVELSSWLLGVLLANGVPELFEETVFARAMRLLGSPNLPLKCMALDLMNGILRNWSMEGRLSEMSEVVSQLPFRRLKAVWESRVAFEESEQRVFFSKFVAACTELLSLTQHLFENALCNDPQVVSSSSSTQVSAEGQDLDSVVGLVVTKALVNQLDVSWSRASSSSAPSRAPFHVQLLKEDDEALVSQVHVKEPWYSFSSLQPNTSYLIRVNGGSAEVKARTKEAFKFTFDPVNCGPHVSISEKGLSASFSATETWSTVLGTTGFTSGRHTWQVRVDSSDSPYLFVGVATRKACLTTFLGGDEHGWGYIGDRALYHKRNRVSVYGDRFGQGDTITVVLDMDQSTLSFSRNGKSLGVAVEGLAGRLFPAFAFYTGAQRISLVRKSILESAPSPVVEPLGPPVKEQLGSVLACIDEVNAFCRNEVASSISDRAFDVLQDWASKRTVRKWTRVEQDIELVAPKTHKKVQTALGVGMVVGTCPRTKHTWIEYDHMDGCWFVESEELMEVLEEEAIQDTEDAEDAEEDVTTVRSGAVRKRLEGLDRAGFAHLVELGSVQKLQDHALVAELGSLCERRGLNPYNVKLCAFLKDVLQTGARGMTEDDAVVACVRFAILKVINDRLRTVLPFTSSMVNHTEQIAVAPLNKSGSAPGGRAFALLNLAQKARVLRKVMFSHTKKMMLRAALERSATVPKRAEDDYDYPEELPQLMLNRPKASFSRTLSDAESRLSFSLFGQAFDELHFLEPRILRIAYAHPMDEGQVRAFKVKFEGEGVDDYGGPYREVFTQWSAELTSTTLSPDGAAEDATPDFAVGTDGADKDSGTTGEEGGKPTLSIDVNAPEAKASDPEESIQCVLPLLHPCPNRQHGVGANREKFVLRPGSSLATKGSGAHLLLEMYNFLGQLMGMSLRTKTNLNLDLASTIWKPLVTSALSLEDLKDVDHSTVSMAELMLQASPDPYVLEAMCEELRWITALSDGTQVELCPGGAQSKLDPADAQQYAKVLVQTRLQEAQHATNAVRDGLASVIPGHLLSLFTPVELERAVCGSPELNIELLQQCTDYDDDLSPDDPHIKSFWRVLQDFSNIERQRFLRFVWARSRLPPTKEEFPQHLKIQAPVGEGPREDPDSWLPKAHTCFFSLSLPKYTSDKVMRQKLLYAIQNCLEMDADFRLTEAEMTGW